MYQWSQFCEGIYSVVSLFLKKKFSHIVIFKSIHFDWPFCCTVSTHNGWNSMARNTNGYCDLRYRQESKATQREITGNRYLTSGIKLNCATTSSVSLITFWVISIGFKRFTVSRAIDTVAPPPKGYESGMTGLLCPLRDGGGGGVGGCWGVRWDEMTGPGVISEWDEQRAAVSSEPCCWLPLLGCWWK